MLTGWTLSAVLSYTTCNRSLLSVFVLLCPALYVLQAGKGRTGIMICCLLLYLHMNAPNLPNLLLPPKEALPAATASAAAQQVRQGRASAGMAALAAAATTEVAAAVAAAAASAAEPASAPGSTQLQPDAAVAACTAAGPAARAHSDAGSDCSGASGDSGDGSGRGSKAGGTAATWQLAKGMWHPWQMVLPLQLQPLEEPVRDVLELYAERRTHDGNGVTIRSQRR